MFTLLCMLHVWVTAGSHDRSPFGPRMCDQLCRHTFGCHSYTYSAEGLVCHAKSANYPSQSKDEFRFLYDVSEEPSWNTSLKNTCPIASRIFQTRSKKITCQASFDGMSHADTTQHPWNSHKMRTRLLMSKPRNIYQQQLKQLKLNTSVVSVYPTLINCKVRALLYVPLPGQIIIAVNEKTDLMTLTLDDGKRSTLRIGLRVKDMDVDERRQVIFLNVFKSGIQVYSISTTGANVTHVFTITRYKYALDIVVDEKRRQIYISTNADIISSSYEGKVIQTIIVKGPIRADLMALEPKDDVLYYTSNKSIVGLSLPTNSSRIVTHVSSSAFDMVHYDYKLYVSTSGQIVTVHLKSNDRYESQLPPSYAAYVCLIP